MRLRPGLLALLYGRIHKQITEEILSRPHPTAPRGAPRMHAVSPAAPGTSARASGEHCFVAHSMPRRDLSEGIQTVTELWYNNNKWPRKRSVGAYI